MKKRSPRSPSISLVAALAKAEQIYVAEGGIHPIPNDVAAKHMGYRNAKSGSAATTIANLKYYGLLEKAQEGFVTLPQEYVEYKFAPNDTIKAEIIKKWLYTPVIFADLLERGINSLPSDDTLKFTLVQKSFSPKAADTVIKSIRASVDLVKPYDTTPKNEHIEPDIDLDSEDMDLAEETTPLELATAPTEQNVTKIQPQTQPQADPDNYIRLPVTLKDNRMAYIEFPKPFLLADKDRLVKYIELQLADDE